MFQNGTYTRSSAITFNPGFAVHSLSKDKFYNHSLYDLEYVYVAPISLEIDIFDMGVDINHFPSHDVYYYNFSCSDQNTTTEPNSVGNSSTSWSLPEKKIEEVLLILDEGLNSTGKDF